MRATILCAALAAVAGCAGPEEAGQRVGQSLYNASVGTGRALATAGDRTGQALQRTGDGLRRAFNPAPPAEPPLSLYPDGSAEPPGTVVAQPLPPAGAGFRRVNPDGYPDDTGEPGDGSARYGY